MYLDPHTEQDALRGTSNQLSSEEVASCHCIHPKLMAISEVDPSLSLGFYIRDQASFEEFQFNVKALKDKSPIIFQVHESRPDFMRQDDFVSCHGSSGGEEEDREEGEGELVDSEDSDFVLV